MTSEELESVKDQYLDMSDPYDKRSYDKLSKIFDLEPIGYKNIMPKETDITPSVIETSDEQVDTDFDHVRGNIRELLSTGR